MDKSECNETDCKTCDKKGNCDQEQDVSVRASLGRIKQKFIILSGKGGVGKSSVSVNLAMALARKGHDVGLMDVDIHGPDIPHMLGQKGLLGLNEDRKLIPLAYSDKLKTVSIDSLNAVKDNAIIWRGPIKHNVIRQFIGDVEWGDLDFLLIDSPPGTGDEPLTVSQVVPGARAIIVTTPQEVALADVRKSINFCNTVKMDIFGVVENMSGYICPHCKEVVNIFGSGGGEKTAEAFGLTFLGKIPLDPEMVSCGDMGVSYQEKYPESEVTKAFERIAGKMADSLSNEREAALSQTGTS